MDKKAWVRLEGHSQVKSDGKRTQHMQVHDFRGSNLVVAQA